MCVGGVRYEAGKKVHLSFTMRGQDLMHSIFGAAATNVPRSPESLLSGASWAHLGPGTGLFGPTDWDVFLLEDAAEVFLEGPPLSKFPAAYGSMMATRDLCQIGTLGGNVQCVAGNLCSHNFK